MSTRKYKNLSDSISLFKHAAKKGDIWHARIKLEKPQNKTRYKWISLRTTSLKKAKTKAQEKEVEFRTLQKRGESQECELVKQET